MATAPLLDPQTVLQFTQQFSREYVRVHREGGTKLLSCFPKHRGEAHQSRHCYSDVEVRVASPGLSQSTASAFRIFGYLHPAALLPHLALKSGAKMTRAKLDRLLRTLDETSDTHLREGRLVFTEHGECIATFEAGWLRGWNYFWDARPSQGLRGDAQVKHCFEVVLFRYVEEDQWAMIQRQPSPSFVVIPGKKKKKQKKSEKQAAGQEPPSKKKQKKSEKQAAGQEPPSPKVNAKRRKNDSAAGSSGSPSQVDSSPLDEGPVLAEMMFAKWSLPDQAFSDKHSVKLNQMISVSSCFEANSLMAALRAIGASLSAASRLVSGQASSSSLEAAPPEKTLHGLSTLTSMLELLEVTKSDGVVLPEEGGGADGGLGGGGGSSSCGATASEGESSREAFVLQMQGTWRLKSGNLQVLECYYHDCGYPWLFQKLAGYVYKKIWLQAVEPNGFKLSFDMWMQTQTSKTFTGLTVNEWSRWQYAETPPIQTRPLRQIHQLCVVFVRARVRSDGVLDLEVIGPDLLRWIPKVSFSMLFLNDSRTMSSQIQSWFDQLHVVDSVGLPKNLDRELFVLHSWSFAFGSHGSQKAEGERAQMTCQCKALAYNPSTLEWDTERANRMVSYQIDENSAAPPAAPHAATGKRTALHAIV